MAQRGGERRETSRLAIVGLGGGLGLIALLTLGSGGWLLSQRHLPATVTASPAVVPLTSPPPAPTFPPTWTPTATSPPTETPTDTAVPSATHTWTPIPTQTPSATNTPKPTPTPTPLWATAVPGAWVGEPPAGAPHPTLADFWEGRAAWQLDIFDVGLPVGESDTLIGPDGRLWSYLHASYPSARIVDQWGEAAPFPGCVTLWVSADGGRSFHPFAPQCLIQCRDKPCASEADQVEQQQYPRVARADSGRWVMVYEWGARTVLRTSADGLNWSAPAMVQGTGQWRSDPLDCRPFEAVGAHPFVDSAQEYNCLIGGPPGLYVEGDQLYVFVGLGKNPGRMACFVGLMRRGAAGLRRCNTDVLFQGSDVYGPLDVTGAEVNPYFDFRIISSADVLLVNDRYYMAYEGVRGPSAPGAGDTQFNLGFARSLGAWIDGPWEKYPGNPALMDAPGNVGVGHADLIVLDGVTYLYTATSAVTRGRYVLTWR